MKQRILSILVDNTAGVLSRVSGLFSRRGYNIDSLTVGVTADPRYSRMTVVCSGDDQVLDQITKQLNKLVDVRHIKILEPAASVIRELILIKVRVNKANRQAVISIADIFTKNGLRIYSERKTKQADMCRIRRRSEVVPAVPDGEAPSRLFPGDIMCIIKIKSF